MIKLRIVLLHIRFRRTWCLSVTGNSVASGVKSMSRSTVYRILNKAERLGLIRASVNHDKSISWELTKEGIGFLDGYRELPF